MSSESMPSCAERNCQHTFEEHIDAWFVSGVLLSSMQFMTATKWGGLVISRGDSWLLTPGVESAFDAFQALWRDVSLGQGWQG